MLILWIGVRQAAGLRPGLTWINSKRRRIGILQYVASNNDGPYKARTLNPVNDWEQTMKRRTFMTTLIAGAMALPGLTGAQPGPGPGKGPGAGPGQGMMQPGPGSGRGPGAGSGQGMMQQRWSRERLYGSPLMTLEERQEHQRQMWNAKTVAERQKIRDEQRARMLERAKQQNSKIDPRQDDVYSVPAIPK